MAIGGMVIDIASWVLLVAGALFCIAGGVGMLRFPESTRAPTRPA